MDLRSNQKIRIRGEKNDGEDEITHRISDVRKDKRNTLKLQEGFKEEKAAIRPLEGFKRKKKMHEFLVLIEEVGSNNTT